MFLPRADIATETLAAGLVELGWEVEDVTAYRTVRAAPPPAETREAIKTGGFDAVAVHLALDGAQPGRHRRQAAPDHGRGVHRARRRRRPPRSTACGSTSSPRRAPWPALVEALAAHGEALRTASIESGEGTWRPSRRRATARRKAT